MGWTGWQVSEVWTLMSEASSVKAIKMSAKLAVGKNPQDAAPDLEPEIVEAL
jgi:hypothetical protein